MRLIKKHPQDEIPHFSAFLKCDGNRASCFRYIYVFRKRVTPSLGDSIKFLLYFRNEVSIVFPSYLSQDVSAVVRFCYVFETDFNILVKSLQ